MKRDPIQSQRLALQRIVSRGVHTHFGQAHRFGTIRGYEDFRRLVPLRTYADYEPYLQRIRAGQSDVLSAGRPLYFARTGGTTGKEKLLPIYPPAIRQSRASFETAVALHLAERPKLALRHAKMLFLGACTPLLQVDALPTGFMSSILAKELSPLVRSRALPGARVDHIPDWSAKIEAIYEMTRQEDIVVAAAMPPWLCAFFDYVVKREDQLIARLWPNLSLIVHSGVGMDGYRTQLLDLLGPGREPVRLCNGFGATEGNFAVQDLADDPAMLLLADEVFFEFVPLDEYLAGRAEAARIPLEGVRTGIDYALVLTTPGGLSAYVIGDTVRFASCDPYRIGISGRTAQFMNVAGEKMSVEQAVLAMERAASATHAQILEFTAFPRAAQRGENLLPGHEWLVEFTRPPSSRAAFLEELDAALKEQNPLYRVRRCSRFGDTALLSPPSLREVPRGTYLRWQRSSNRLGGQFKVPRISQDYQMINQLTEGACHESEFFRVVA